jgi:hypothetical protein
MRRGASCGSARIRAYGRNAVELADRSGGGAALETARARLAWVEFGPDIIPTIENTMLPIQHGQLSKKGHWCSCAARGVFPIAGAGTTTHPLQQPFREAR